MSKPTKNQSKKNKEKVSNNCFNRFGSFTKCYASGGFVAPIYNGSLRKNLFKTKFEL